MQKIKLELLNFEASRIALGTWAIGGDEWGGTEEKDAIKTIHSAFDIGINIIDTAPAYGEGKSEEIIGKSLKKNIDREKVLISTKAGLEWNEKGTRFRNSTKERIKKEIEDSLKRLQTEYIDIYFIHWPDPLVDVKEPASALFKLFEEGKIKSIGVSNFSVEQIEEFRKEAPLHFCQSPYNIFEREIEKNILPYCREHKIYLITYGALCRGLLSGKMEPDTEFKGDDLRKKDPKFNFPRYKNYLLAVKKINELALSNYDKNIIHLAVRWIFDKSSDIAIWGSRKPSQLEAMKEIWTLPDGQIWKIDEPVMEEIDEILKTTIEDPVGPEFMAPQNRA